MAPNTSVALLLEDEPLIAMDVEMMLEAAGFEVSTVLSCQDANAWLDLRTPDLVVVAIEVRDEQSTNIAARLIAATIPYIVHSGNHSSLYRGGRFPQDIWLNKPDAQVDLVQAAFAPVERTPMTYYG